MLLLDHYFFCPFLLLALFEMIGVMMTGSLCFEQACHPNPCMRGGTCWVSSGSFFCVCKPGLSGDRCQGIVVLGFAISFYCIQYDSSDSVPFALLRESENSEVVTSRVTNNRSCRLVLSCLVSSFLVVDVVSCFLAPLCVSSRSDRFAFTLNLSLCCFRQM